MAYYDATHKDLDFTQFDGKTWHTVAIDTVGSVGKYASLKFDASGNPWIAYYDETNTNLKLAHRTGTTWSIQTVDSTGQEGRYASLALTKAGLPVIAYQGDDGTTRGALKLATDSASGWSIQTVDSNTSAGPIAFCSLALTSSDQPRIAYQSNEIEYVDQIDITTVEYASFNGTAWTLSQIDNGPFGGGTRLGIELLLDSKGHPHVSYSAPDSAYQLDLF